MRKIELAVHRGGQRHVELAAMAVRVEMGVSTNFSAGVILVCAGQLPSIQHVVVAVEVPAGSRATPGPEEVGKGRGGEDCIRGILYLLVRRHGQM